MTWNIKASKRRLPLRPSPLPPPVYGPLPPPVYGPWPAAALPVKRPVGWTGPLYDILVEAVGEGGVRCGVLRYSNHLLANPAMSDHPKKGQRTHWVRHPTDSGTTTPALRTLYMRMDEFIRKDGVWACVDYDEDDCLLVLLSLEPFPFQGPSGT